MLTVIRDAATVDPDAADLWGRIETEFHDNQASIIKVIHKRKGLRPGLGIRRATDIPWTLNHPDRWRLLVVKSGWTPAEYEQWTARLAREQLLK